MLTDLSEIIRYSDSPLTESQVKSYMKMLLSGVEILHAHGIMHRVGTSTVHSWTMFNHLMQDLKPANLLISAEGVLKIADFGLARIFQEDDAERLYSHQVATRYVPPFNPGLTTVKMVPSSWTAVRRKKIHQQCWPLVWPSLYYLTVGGCLGLLDAFMANFWTTLQCFQLVQFIVFYIVRFICLCVCSGWKRYWAAVVRNPSAGNSIGRIVARKLLTIEHIFDLLVPINHVHDDASWSTSMLL